MNEQLNNVPIPEGLTKHERRKLLKEQKRQEKTRQANWKKLTKVALFVVVGLVILGGSIIGIKEITKPLPGEFVPSLGNLHIESISTPHVQYNSLPPTSGPHVGGKAEWGTSDKPIPDELQVHNLEDGGVVVQYNCPPGKNTSAEATIGAELPDDCTKLISQLTDIVKKYNDKVLLAPYPTLDTKIALTAWTRIDTFNEFDRDRVERFIKAFRGIDHHKG